MTLRRRSLLFPYLTALTAALGRLGEAAIGVALLVLGSVVELLSTVLTSDFLILKLHPRLLWAGVQYGIRGVDPPCGLIHAGGEGSSLPPQYVLFPSVYRLRVILSLSFLRSALSVALRRSFASRRRRSEGFS